MPRSRRCRLYLITPPEIADPGAFRDPLARALDAGDVAALQLRLKSPAGVAPPDADLRALADLALPLAHAAGTAVIVNDRPDLAVALGADGAHVGQSDMGCAEARRLLGPDRTLGVTCHASRHLALEAGEAGADYVAFGAFFPTDTKAATARAETDLLSWWQELMELPCVAIGGITLANAAPLVAAGADFLAVSAGVWRHADGPAAAVREFNALFDRLAEAAA